MTDWSEDKDNDGVPDAIEEVLEATKASLMSRTFTKRNMYMSILVGVIIAGYGLFAYMYLSLRDEKIALQNQFDWAKSEQEIEVNKARMDERVKVTKELYDKSKALDDKLDSSRASLDIINNSITNKPYRRNNENEISEMDNTELSNSFDALGFPTTKKLL